MFQIKVIFKTRQGIQNPVREQNHQSTNRLKEARMDAHCILNETS